MLEMIFAMLTEEELERLRQQLTDLIEDTESARELMQATYARGILDLFNTRTR